MSDSLIINRQWSTRPDEQRFTSLHAMRDELERIRNASRAVIAPSRKIHALPDDTGTGLLIAGGAGVPYAPTHAAFGQLATLAKAPAGYLRTLPAPMAADCLNWGYHSRDIEDVGLLLMKDDTGGQLRAATGPKYGRIWDHSIVDAIIREVGDGCTGQWKVPGEFGIDVPVTKQNTTLYASDRDMFIFLCDEQHRIELPNRRDGQTGTLARGFGVKNSETGDGTFDMFTFLFDFICRNRTVWGMQQFKQVKIRHTASAPTRFIEEVMPALQQIANGSTHDVVRAIEDARSHRLDNVSEFLAKRYGPRVAERIENAHLADEGRPIESRWDAVNGITAYARQIPYQADRVTLETSAGDLMAN